MGLRVGLVGIGPWGLKLAEKFREAGAEIVAHCRKQGLAVEELGLPLSIQDMLGGYVDAIICAAPPDVTRDVAIACAAAGMPVLATKPLMLDDEIELKAPFYVDYVYLWSPAWRQHPEGLKSRIIVVPRRIFVEMCGKGPVRSFSGLLDYGAHAFAFIHDLSLREIDLHSCDDGVIQGRQGLTALTVFTGNSWPARRCRVTVITGGDDEIAFVEGVGARNQAELLTSSNRRLFKGDPLLDMVKAFVSDVNEKRVDDRWMKLTVAVTRSLRAVERAAGLGVA